MERESVIKILHLEDNSSDAQLVQLALKRAKVTFEYFLVDNEKEYVFYLENQKIDIILSDYHLPGYNGSEALILAKNNYPHIPFVFVSGTMGEDAAIESLLNGATDYVLKNKMERLGAAVHRAFKEEQERKARQKAEQALLQSEENFHRSISESPLGIRIVSVDGKTIYANRAFLDIYDFNSLEEFISTPAIIRYTPESYVQHQERKERRKNGQDVLNYELSIVGRNKAIRHVKVSRKEVLWNGIMHYQVINQDITEQKKLTFDLIAAKEKAEESDRLKTAFLHNISHEIRTPMNAIVGFSEFLNDPELTHEKREHFTNIIVHSSNQLLSIISDIVSIATIESGQEKVQEKEIDLNSTLKLLHEQFILKAKMQNVSFYLRTSLSDRECKIISDETKLVQILTNLIGNAIKFTKQGHINFGYNIIETHGIASLIEFYVEDTGIGIPSEMHEEIFKRFRQVESTIARKFGGSGLGLSISKAYVELLGGKMWLTSKLDKGSSFYFTIPYKKTHSDTASENQSNNSKSIGIKETYSLLVVEDEDSNFMLLEEFFSSLNINIIRVINGAEAIEKCKTTHIDIVLMDIKMPVLDGYDATKQIREFKPDLPIIAQTAYTTDFDKDKALACGCNDFISKPIKLDLLISKIKKQLNKS